MRVRRQDLCVLAFYFLGFSNVRNLLSRLQARPLVRFIAFHDILEGTELAFQQKLRFLKERTNVVSMADFFAGKLSTRRLNVVITFDDGYKSWRTIAAPALKALGLPATFFVSSGFIGLPAIDAKAFLRSRLRTQRDFTGCLDERDVLDLATQGFTIGGHTCGHIDLSEARDERETLRDILLDRERLSAITQMPVDYFAYPFGACDNSIIDLRRILQAAGYRGAVTTIPGFNTPQGDPYFLKRELTDAPMPISVFKARVNGNHDGVAGIKAGARAFGLGRA